MEKLMSIKFQHSAQSLTLISHYLSVRLFRKKIGEMSFPFKLLVTMVVALFIGTMFNAIQMKNVDILAKIMQLVVIFISFYLMAVMICFLQLKNSNDERILGPQKVTVDGEGVCVSYEGYTKEHFNWTAIQSIFMSKQTLYLMTAEMVGICLPLEALSEGQLTVFFEIVELAGKKMEN